MPAAGGPPHLGFDPLQALLQTVALQTVNLLFTKKDIPISVTRRRTY